MAEEFSDAHSVDITAEEAPSKISELEEKISDLEQENSKINLANKEYEQRMEELKSSITELRSEKEELKKDLDEAQSDNKALAAVAVRAAELETEVSRLQHDLISAMSDLEEAKIESSDLKRNLEGTENREKEKDVKLEAAQREKVALVAEVEKLTGVERALRVELEGKEKEIQVLKSSMKKMEGMVEKSKSFEMSKKELETKIVNMKAHISGLESSVDEKEKMLSAIGREEVQEVVNRGMNGDGEVKSEKKGFFAGLEQKDWLILVGSASTIAAIAVSACYAHAARKH